jgi:hypothetical protein
VPALPPSGKRAAAGASPSGDRTPSPASSTGPGAAARAFALSETRVTGEGPAAAPPEGSSPEDRAGAGAAPKAGGHAVDERRGLAPHVLLGGGALLAAAAIVVVMGIRSGRHEEVAAPATSDAAVAPVAAAASPSAAVAANAPAARDVAATRARAGYVLVMIEGTPPNTEVRRGGVLLGIAPGRVELPRSEREVVLMLSADGYQPATLSVIPADDLTRRVELKPRRVGGRPDSEPEIAPFPPAGGSGAKPAGGSGAKPAGGSGAKPAGGSGAKPGSGSDEPTNDIETFPPAPPPKSAS